VDTIASATEPTTTLLRLSSVSVAFGGLLALGGIDLDVARGERLAVLGPNGAGKTTLFNMIAGVLAPDTGTITFAGERIDGLTSDKICRRGIGRTFQIVRPFPALTVEDNVVIGALLHRQDVDDAREHARDVLRRLDLYVKRNQTASSLTLPDRKRLELARSLATDPKLLLLDEVMAGLRPMEVDVVVATLRELNRETGLTILLIEHVMRAVMALAARILVLHHGAAIAEGAPDAVVRNPAVIDSYLGAEAVG
jgi:branched-chain amino acid transport system ATP-binding protein